MKKFSGKTAIVTGAAQGIGAEYARGLAQNGAAICVCDVLDTEEVVAEINAHGGNAIGIKADITSADQMKQVVEDTVRAFGSVDILVNNAAIFASLSRQSFMDISSDDWSRVMDVNVRGTFEAIRAVTPEMQKKGYGKIVNISSTTVFVGQPMLLHYVTSKGAVLAMTRSLARELGPLGIRINCIAPGFTLSEGVNENSQFTAEVKQNVAAMRSIARDQLPEDLVGTLLFLCSEDSDFLTGQTIAVDGGSTLR